jgi:[ribosomal protein S5]-alanine N-acetyltransferase
LVGVGIAEGLIETERLFLRPFRPDDLAAAYAWFGDPLVMKYTPTGPDTSLDASKERLERYQAHQVRHGFSKWLIVERASGRPIGDTGLLVLEELSCVDLGFRLAPGYWGRGLAMEAASAWVARAFGALGMSRLDAFSHPDNAGSLRVLDKLGFRRQRHDTIMGMPAICFSLEPG